MEPMEQTPGGIFIPLPPVATPPERPQLRAPRRDEWGGLCSLGRKFREEMYQAPCPDCGGDLEGGLEHESMIELGCPACWLVFRIGIDRVDRRSAYDPNTNSPKPARTDETKQPPASGLLHGLPEEAHQKFLAFRRRYQFPAGDER